MILTPEMPITRGPRFKPWLEANGLRADRIYRMEIDQSTLVAMVYEYAGRDDGKTDLERRRTPYRVTLNSLPPERVEQMTQGPGELR